MVKRVLRIKIFAASTVEALERKAGVWLAGENVCLGNYVDARLNQLGNVYQLVLVYGEAVDSEPKKA